MFNVHPSCVPNKITAIVAIVANDDFIDVDDNDTVGFLLQKFQKS